MFSNIKKLKNFEYWVEDFKDELKIQRGTDVRHSKGLLFDLRKLLKKPFKNKIVFWYSLVALIDLFSWPI